MKAQDIIISIIRNEVAMYNRIDRDGCYRTIERRFAELRGMLICLKNITTSDNVFAINDLSDGTLEFGYYDGDGLWISIEGKSE